MQLHKDYSQLAALVEILPKAVFYLGKLTFRALLTYTIKS